MPSRQAAVATAAQTHSCSTARRAACWARRAQAHQVCVRGGCCCSLNKEQSQGGGVYQGVGVGAALTALLLLGH